MFLRKSVRLIALSVRTDGNANTLRRKSRRHLKFCNKKYLSDIFVTFLRQFLTLSPICWCQNSPISEHKYGRPLRLLHVYSRFLTTLPLDFGISFTEVRSSWVGLLRDAYVCTFVVLFKYEYQINFFTTFSLMICSGFVHIFRYEIWTNLDSTLMILAWLNCKCTTKALF